jgi:hypothetical protein
VQHGFRKGTSEDPDYAEIDNAQEDLSRPVPVPDEVARAREAARLQAEYALNNHYVDRD